MNSTFLTNTFNKLKSEIEDNKYRSDISTIRVELSEPGEIPCSQVLSIIFEDYWNEDNYGIDVSFNLYENFNTPIYELWFSICYGDGHILYDYKEEIAIEDFTTVNVNSLIDKKIIPMVADNKEKLIEAIKKFPIYIK